MKVMKQKKRGTFDFRSDGNLEVFRLNDNSVVTLVRNSVGIEPLEKVKSRVKGNR